MENYRKMDWQKYYNQIENESKNESKKVIYPIFDSSITSGDFLKAFKIKYKLLYKKDFIEREESTLFFYTLYYFFFRKSNFNNSPLLFRDNLDISLDKGLIIFGGCGVGKTSIINTFVALIKEFSLNYHQIPVRMNYTKDIVLEFEKTEFEYRNEIIEKYSKGFQIFDDVKYEHEATYYGKKEVIGDILYKRCETRNFRTILTCNYDSENPKDINQAIESLLRYGDRVYDRLFEAFNFVELKALSSRR